MRFHFLTPTGELRWKRRKRDWRHFGAVVLVFIVTWLALIGAVAVVFWIAGETI